jgi:hypothetical protein
MAWIIPIFYEQDVWFLKIYRINKHVIFVKLYI